MVGQLLAGQSDPPAVSAVSRPFAALADEALYRNDAAAAAGHIEQAYAAFDMAFQQWE